MEWKTYDDIKNVEWIFNEELSDSDGACYNSRDNVLICIDNNILYGHFFKEEDHEGIWFVYRFNFNGEYGDILLDSELNFKWHVYDFDISDWLSKL